MKKPSQYEARLGAGKFQWNAGAWFGAQLGSTSWMLTTAFMCFAESPLVASIFLASFLLTNQLGWMLWCARIRICPYTALQSFVGLSACISCVSLVAAWQICQFTGAEIRGIHSGPRTFLLIPVLYGGLSVLFAIIQHTSSRPRLPSKG